MAISKENPELDPIFEKQKIWKTEMLALRKIVLECGLDEVKKWWQPCYSYNGTNLLIIGSFKDYCTLSFFKGVLLKDEHNLLEFAGPNTQSSKIIKFRSIDEIDANAKILKSYIEEAVELEKAGKKVAFKPISEHNTPQELQEIFAQNSEFENAFKALTPGRQRSWLLHFTSAKQTATKISRIERSMPKNF